MTTLKRLLNDTQKIRTNKNSRGEAIKFAGKIMLVGGTVKLC